MKKKSDLSFEDFDYQKAKELLPDGYEPCESLPVQLYAEERLIKIIGYSSPEKAQSRMLEFQTLCQSNKYQIIPYEIEQTFKSFAIIAPESCASYLRDGETLCSDDRPIISLTNYEPVLYRFFDKKEYEEAFFERGELLISTYRRCKTGEVKDRQDKYETQNKIVIADGKYTMETVIGFEFETLLLCTSLSQENKKNYDEYGFKINDPSAFSDMLTRAIVSKGVAVYELLKGPCVYNNKQISIDASGTGLAEEFLRKSNAGTLDFAPAFRFICEQAQNHIMMNKPTTFTSESEYRFIWKLSKPICKEDVSDDVTVKEDGSIIARIPELIQFCERL